LLPNSATSARRMIYLNYMKQVSDVAALARAASILAK
jgi:hypothetical protein